jgi:hypothetical protein
MIMSMIGFLVWGVSRMRFSQDEPETTSTLPQVADILLGEGTPTPVFIDENEEVEEVEEVIQLIPTSTPFYIPSESNATLEIVLLIRQNIWLKIISDGNTVFQGREVDGNVLTFRGEEEIELETGNIAAIEIIFNQQSLNSVNDRIGTAAHLIFTSDGWGQLPIPSNSGETP